MAILDSLNDPAQLRGMSRTELATLADELRAKMIRTVHHTGGHLASSLGTVELTLALHRVMDSPRDRHRVGHRTPGLRPQAAHRTG